jgi:8-oxo-dGTP diphosphatase
VDARRYVVNVEAVVCDNGRYLMIVRGKDESIAPGTLTPPGGKVEVTGSVRDALEDTLRREVREETGVEVKDGFAYVESHSFEGAGQTIVDIVFLARYRDGELRAEDADEVAGIAWLTYDEVMADPRTMSWTRETMRLAESRRRELGW